MTDAGPRILEHRDGAVLTLTMDYPARRNALALPLRAQLTDILEAAQGDAALDLLAEELRLAHDALGEITGAFTADDLLGEIFGRFCIGK